MNILSFYIYPVNNTGKSGVICKQDKMLWPAKFCECEKYNDLLGLMIYSFYGNSTLTFEQAIHYFFLLNKT